MGVTTILINKKDSQMVKHVTNTLTFVYYECDGDLSVISTTLQLAQVTLLSNHLKHHPESKNQVRIYIEDTHQTVKDYLMNENHSSTLPKFKFSKADREELK